MIIAHEQRYNRSKTLPAPIRQVITDFETPIIVEEIGRKNNLHIDQIGELSDEVALTLLGFTRIGEFLTNLQSRLKINKETAEKITGELNEKIFLPIKEELQKIPADKLYQEKPISEQKPEKPDETKAPELPKPPRPTDIPNYTGEEQPLNDFQKKTWQEIASRDALIREIENPSIAPLRSHSYSSNKNSGEAPSNSPVEENTPPEEKSSLFKPPILRTMEQDMKNPEGKATEETIQKEEPKKVEKPAEHISQIPPAPELPKNLSGDFQSEIKKGPAPIAPQNLPIHPNGQNQMPQIRGKFGLGQPPRAGEYNSNNINQNEINKSSEENISQIKKPSNFLEMSLEQKVKEPMIKKNYVVDPYREPAE